MKPNINYNLKSTIIPPVFPVKWTLSLHISGIRISEKIMINNNNNDKR